MNNNRFKDPDMKKFSKIKLLEKIGCLVKKFDGDQFKASYRLQIRSLLVLFFSTTVPFKKSISLLYDQNDPTQLLIGSFFNYLPDGPRELMAIVSFDIGLWLTSLIILFSYLNYKREGLILLWWRMSNEISVKNHVDFQLIGLSKRRNDEFWKKENKFNLIYDKILKFFIFFICVVFNFPILMKTYGFKPYIYIPLMTIQFLHNSFYVFVFFEMVYFNIFFFLTIIKFFSKKFNYIKEKLKRLNFKNAQSDNRKLSELIFGFNCVHLELVKINNLFKNFVGINLTYFFFLCVLASFVAILVDNRLRLGIASCVVFWFIAIVYFPFTLVGDVLEKMQQINKHLQNLSFDPKISFENKKHINSINYRMQYNQGFTCFGLFPLSSYNCLQIILNMIAYILMLIKVAGIFN